MHMILNQQDVCSDDRLRVSCTHTDVVNGSNYLSLYMQYHRYSGKTYMGIRCMHIHRIYTFPKLHVIQGMST